MNLNQVTLPSLDVAASIAFYRALGLHLIVDAQPRYARFECPDGGSTLSVHRVEAVGRPSGAVVYFECGDVDDQVERLKGLGIAIEQDARDERWLWREARLRDPAGNEICLFHAGQNRRFPPWRLSEPPASPPA